MFQRFGLHSMKFQFGVGGGDCCSDGLCRQTPACLVLCPLAGHPCTGEKKTPVQGSAYGKTIAVQTTLTFTAVDI